ncbi:hypothetical protein [uncultured Devosia sp.]|uniref:hypothetical protein n=1 Tax=uncultured Devosia sp. TaxID=211434 RepID=UPI0026085FA1|nr:hypothetical protein [uncultured Devosia sp.]
MRNDQPRLRDLTLAEQALVILAWTLFLGICGLIFGLILEYGTPILAGPIQ